MTVTPALPRFPLEIDAEELGLLLNAMADRMSRMAVEARRLKGPDKAAFQLRMEVVRARYDELDHLLDRHALDERPPVTIQTRPV